MKIVQLYVFCLFLLLTIFLGGCFSNEPSHLPTVFELPGAVVGSVVENTVYNARRKRVEKYIASHYVALRQDVENGGGQVLEGTLDSGRLKGDERQQAKNDLIVHKEQYFYNVESVTGSLISPFAALYVDSSSPRDKRINGFTYIEARSIIEQFAEQNFEALRQDIKRGGGEALNQLALRLHIHDPQKRTQFIQKARRLYATIYLEPVIVVIMVYS